MNIVQIRGSHGYLNVHQASGLVISGETWHFDGRQEYLLDGIPEEYADIAFFDAQTLTHSHMDILSTGYFTVAGHYEKPMVFVDDYGWEDAERIAA